MKEGKNGWRGYRSTFSGIDMKWDSDFLSKKQKERR